MQVNNDPKHTGKSTTQWCKKENDGLCTDK